jgi:hypothetical protein
MAERVIDLVGAVARAQEQDLARLRGPDPGRAEAHQAEELGRALAHVAERDAELIEIDRAPALRRRMEPGGIELLAGAARGELVTRDAPQIGGVHEQLALGDAHRQEVGDVVVGHGVVTMWRAT